ncbi:TRAP transporter large permease subunit [Paenisporosarcina indica]|uniref:TRAP transporter large permease subunit n=1 Tax=Paenisporosarcina indica TaxID=650093 RepID=UPI00094F6079|nr:TRAP transporter large permease subunit [Paenisporosarcina indica]
MLSSRDIGLFTPPVGLNLYVAASILNTNIVEIPNSVVPFLISSIIVLMRVTYIPVLSAFQPVLFGVKKGDDFLKFNHEVAIITGRNMKPF